MDIIEHTCGNNLLHYFVVFFRINTCYKIILTFIVKDDVRRMLFCNCL